MGSHLTKHRSSNTVGTQASSQPSEVDRQRERLRTVATAECKALAHAHNTHEVNIFFVPVPGVDFREFVTLFAETTGFPEVKAARDDNELWTQASRLETGWRAEAWTDPTSATKYLLAQQVNNITLTLPRPDHTPPAAHRIQGWPNVRLYTRSPVESRYINFPLLLEGRADAGLAQLLNATTELAWKILQCQCRLGSSVWVYLKMNEDCWTRLKDSHRRAHSTDNATIAQWDAYRQRLNTFFTSNDFQKHYHTLVIEIHNDMFATDDVVNEVASIVAKFVAQQVAANMWDCNVATEEFQSHLASSDYRQSNFVHARQVESFRALLSHLDDNPVSPATAASSTLELVASSSSVSSSLGGRTSSRSPAGSLRRVRSGQPSLQ